MLYDSGERSSSFARFPALFARSHLSHSFLAVLLGLQPQKPPQTSVIFTGTYLPRHLIPAKVISQISDGWKIVPAPPPLRLRASMAALDENPFSVLPDDASDPSCSGPPDTPRSSPPTFGVRMVTPSYSALLKQFTPPGNKKRRTGFAPPTLSKAVAPSDEPFLASTDNEMPPASAQSPDLPTTASLAGDAWTVLTGRKRPNGSSTIPSPSIEPEYSVVFRPKQ